MTTPTDTQSPIITRDNNGSPLDDCVAFDKYSRLEGLLRQTLALAGEIADAKCYHDKRTAARSMSPATPDLPSGCECIVLRKDSAAEPPFCPRYRSYSSSSNLASPLLADTTRHKRFSSGDDSFDADTSSVPSPSVASSVQEPFSPGTLALSLDAIVEERRSDSNDSNLEPFSLDPSSSITSLGNSGGSDTAASVITVGRIPDLMTTAASSPSQLSTPSTPPPSAYGLSSFRPLPSHCRKPFQEGTCCEDQQSAPSRWHLRVSPISSPATGNSAAVAGSCEATTVPSSTPLAATPAYIKLEAVVPYRFACDSSPATVGMSEEGSYIIIGRSRPSIFVRAS